MCSYTFTEVSVFSVFHALVVTCWESCYSELPGNAAAGASDIPEAWTAHYFKGIGAS